MVQNEVWDKEEIEKQRRDRMGLTFLNDLSENMIK